MPNHLLDDDNPPLTAEEEGEMLNAHNQLCCENDKFASWLETLDDKVFEKLLAQGTDCLDAEYERYCNA